MLMTYWSCRHNIYWKFVVIFSSETKITLFYHMVTGDEKWIVYDNGNHCRLWLIWKILICNKIDIIIKKIDSFYSFIWSQTVILFKLQNIGKRCKWYSKTFLLKWNINFSAKTFHNIFKNVWYVQGINPLWLMCFFCITLLHWKIVVHMNVTRVSSLREWLLFKAIKNLIFRDFFS